MELQEEKSRTRRTYNEINWDTWVHKKTCENYRKLLDIYMKLKLDEMC